MIKHLQKVSALALVGFAFLANTEASAQTEPSNPAAQNLPFNMNFSIMEATETLPDGIAVWLTAYNNSKAAAEASTPSADAPILATSAKQTSGSKAYNYTLDSNNRLYIQLTANTSNGSNQLAAAVNTTGKSNISIAYDVELVNDQPRSVGVTLQYRVGRTGAWTTIAGTDYSSVNRTPEGNKESYQVSLPADAENVPEVQLRWATYENVAEGVTGSRDGIAFDNIVISEATTTGIADATKGMFSIYPNPMQNQNVRLSLPGHVGSQKVNLTVWSVEGKALVQASGSQAQVQATLNEKMAALPKGMFFVNVTAGSEIYQTKLLKN